MLKQGNQPGENMFPGREKHALVGPDLAIPKLLSSRKNGVSRGKAAAVHRKQNALERDSVDDSNTIGERT